MVQGKLYAAEVPMREALAILKKVHEEEHPTYASTLNNLALLLHLQVRLADFSR